ncbi:MAG: S8 family peptidase [candidate division Zixibacteria bacterium]|nr:S8 family peptidase [candidate division Zixibacteria bacterium]
MKKFLMSLIFLSGLAGITQAATPPLITKPAVPKIANRFADTLNAAPAERKFRVWVFFADKKIFDEAAYKKAIDNLESRFSPRAMERRQKRNASPTLDFYDIPVSAEYVRALQEAGMEVKNESRWLNAVSGYADYETLQRISAFLFVMKIRPVAGAVKEPLPPVETPKLDGIPLPDSLYGPSLTQLKLINVPLVHRFGFTGKGVLIALFDTGFRLDHPAFDSLHLVAKHDFINNDTSVGETVCSDPNNPNPRHGTLTLSAVAGFDPGHLIGSAYGADFAVAKTEDPCDEVPSEEDNWVAAAEWADSLGADIISSSLGYYDWYTYADLNGHTAAITIAAERAVSRGIAVFNCAGNTRSCGNPDLCFYYIIPPCDGDSVMAIGAVDGLGHILAFSSAGPTYDGRIKPDLVAMGFLVYSADHLGGYTLASGTSLAAPLAAGAAALIWEAHPDWGPVQVGNAMKQSADRYNNPDDLYGYGLFDTYKAADLFRIDSIPPIILAVGDSLNLRIMVSGMEGYIPELSAENLPPTAILVDNQDRTGDLKYKAEKEDSGTRSIVFIATLGAGEYRLAVSLTVLAGRGVTFGPNPFSDSLTIFLGPAAGRPVEISIHSADGEKVWGKLSDNYNSERGTVTWHGVNDRGEKVTPGVYYMIVKTAKSTEKVKLFKK